MPITDPIKKEIAVKHLLMVKFCRECGAKNPASATRCRRCRSKNLRWRKRGRGK
ncbi:MAG: 50S ribosomal protein L40e [Candidatus Baldrarchaeia archaeon]